MRKIVYLSIVVFGLLSSCVSKKQMVAVEKEKAKVQSSLSETKSSLNQCDKEKAAALAQISALEGKINLLKDQINTLNATNASLLNNVGNLATLSTKEAENLEKSLESIKEKDVQIKSLRDAVTKKDSVTLALVTSLKGALGNLNDSDIEVNVEKGVVYISISDKLLFKTGSYRVNEKAKSVLGKVATVVNNKPDIDFMVEGHTDTVPIKADGIKDNWDLSVLRATAVVRVLQEEFNVEPQRMTAAGRSFYVPLVDNETPENRARNRRTRIVVLPKLDQFYNLIETGMKEAENAEGN